MDESLISKAIEYLERSEKFILSETPDVIRQTLLYAKTSTIFEIFALCIAIVSCVFIVLHCYGYKSVERYDEKSFFMILGMFIPSVAIIPLCIQLCIDMQNLLKICLAPKLFLIQYFINMRS